MSAESLKDMAASAVDTVFALEKALLEQNNLYAGMLLSQLQRKCLDLHSETIKMVIAG